MSFISRAVFAAKRTRFDVLPVSVFIAEIQLYNRRNLHASLVKMAQNGRRGAFIVLEGCDRCGKTTQAQLLVSNLKEKGHKTELLRFPDRTTKVGSLISSYLKKDEQLEDHVIHLLFSANRWEMKDKMLNLLKDNTTLIVDRYSFSGVAFSASKLGMELDWCKQPEVGLPSPDVVLFLDLSPEVAARREQFGDEIYENKKTQRRVRNTYDSLMDSNWTVINSDKSVEELQEELLQIAERVIAAVGNSDVKSLFKN